MKTRIIAAAAAAAFLTASCTGDYHNLAPESAETGTVTLNVSLNGPSTKAIVEANSTADMTFHTAQIFVYNKLNKLEAKSGVVTASENIALSIVPGQKTIWAVVNAPELEPSLGTSQSAGTLRSLLSDNALNSIVMSGSLTKEVNANMNVSVGVKHIASKIVLKSIARDFTNAEYDEVPLKLKKIYMSNVAADCDYACSGTAPSVWNCKMGVLADPVENQTLLLDSGYDEVLPQAGAPHSTAHTFYVYPNPTTLDETGDTWSPRKTRLVVECEYNGRSCYYPITIRTDTIERNKVYTISSLTLKRPGSVSPERTGPEVSSDVDCTFSITVSNWETVDPYTEEF